MAFLKEIELEKLGLRAYGQNVLISDKASIYSPENISIGSNVRIDDFCILSGKIVLQSNIHIAAYCALYGKYEVHMEDFTGLSPRCTVFSGMDDFSGEFMVSPMVPENLSNVSGGKVYIRRFSQIGTASMIFPSVEIGEGVAVGAMSLVNKSLKSWGIYAGIPAKYLKDRKKDIMELCKRIDE